MRTPRLSDSPTDSLSLTQECPSGVVNEETFKQIYAQFFPHGGRQRAPDCHLEELNFLVPTPCASMSPLQEMMDIVKAIYDMMGKYTYPVLKEDTPRQHVDIFFQKMDKNKDGIVTLDEFLESCQEDDNIMRSLQLFQNVM
ncbi:hypothetical protein Celaphus_00017871 [Cervus elaphus hippelaphus]|uniref:EF-hand domain-containing protein n=1 Tax=Cervus elaphus hippelaphus TaxID=46360 RepID=A0A212C8I3_CEREH|nr:hypothetical protein Celaphus_00017871 [Cervus elaphus hippelaphus]